MKRLLAAIGSNDLPQVYKNRTIPTFKFSHHSGLEVSLAESTNWKLSKSAQEVKDFYSDDRMKAGAGPPNDKRICDTEDTKNHGALCLFSRKDGGKDPGLAIVVAQNEKLPETNIFYARVDMTK